jgi:rhomboid protease GluP
MPQKKKKNFRLKSKPNIKSNGFYGTYLLIAANLIVFALEIHFGGSENTATLERLGALSPDDIQTNEWWRSISANFIHYGWLHLISNLLGLLAIGRIVEFGIGTIPYLIIYLFSGVGAMLSFSLLAIKLGETNQLAMGASGSIMGLVGVLCVLLLRGWYLEKTWKSAGRFWSIILIIIVQSIFDILTPQVSFIIHFFGLVLGFLLGLAFLCF